MHINEPGLKRIETALAELLHNRMHLDLDPADRALLVDAESACAEVRKHNAAPAQIEAARGEHGSDEIEIDDDAALSDPADGSGYWVSAWVWVPTPDDDLAEAAEDDICTACERDSIDCSRDPCAAVIADRAA